MLGKTEITHLFDYESSDDIHVQQFSTTLQRMKKAQGIGKNIQYKLGYSNFTFELWIVLHKADCNTTLTHRSQYLRPLNQAYNDHFENLDTYKSENNFKRVLSRLSLPDVRAAINRSRSIMKRNVDNQFILYNISGYKYYKDNPSLTIYSVIEEILNDCRLL